MAQIIDLYVDVEGIFFWALHLVTEFQISVDICGHGSGVVAERVRAGLTRIADISPKASKRFGVICASVSLTCPVHV